MATWHHKPRNLPARYYRYIGEIAARWNMVELHLQEIIWLVLELDPKRGRLLTYGQTARAKIEMFRALGEPWIRNHLLVTNIKKLAKDVNRLNNERNRYVHGIFGHEPGKPNDLKLFYVQKAKHKILPHAERKTADDIKKVAADIEALQNELESLLSIFHRPPSKP